MGRIAFFGLFEDVLRRSLAHYPREIIFGKAGPSCQLRERDLLVYLDLLRNVIASNCLYTNQGCVLVNLLDWVRRQG